MFYFSFAGIIQFSRYIWPRYPYWDSKLFTLHQAITWTNLNCLWGLLAFTWGQFHSKYSVVPLLYGQYSHKYSQKTPHSSPVRARYGVSFVDPASDWYSASVWIIIYEISYNSGSCITHATVLRISILDMSFKISDIRLQLHLLGANQVNACQFVLNLMLFLFCKYMEIPEKLTV